MWPQGCSLPHPVSCPLWWAGQLFPKADRPPAERGQPGKVSIPCRVQALLPSHPHPDSCATARRFINPSRPCLNPQASHLPLLAPSHPTSFSSKPSPTPRPCTNGLLSPFQAQLKVPQVCQAAHLRTFAPAAPTARNTSQISTNLSSFFQSLFKGHLLGKAPSTSSGDHTPRDTSSLLPSCLLHRGFSS